MVPRLRTATRLLSETLLCGSGPGRQRRAAPLAAGPGHPLANLSWSCKPRRGRAFHAPLAKPVELWAACTSFAPAAAGRASRLSASGWPAPGHPHPTAAPRPFLAGTPGRHCCTLPAPGNGPLLGATRRAGGHAAGASAPARSPRRQQMQHSRHAHRSPTKLSHLRTRPAKHQPHAHPTARAASTSSIYLSIESAWPTRARPAHPLLLGSALLYYQPQQHVWPCGVVGARAPGAPARTELWDRTHCLVQSGWPCKAVCRMPAPGRVALVATPMYSPPRTLR